MICLQVGQAGCQTGESLFNVLENENASRQRLRYPFNTYRQLLVDTERKTCRQRAKRKPHCLFQIAAKQHATDSRGRGNNWAMGYYGGGEHKDCSTAETDAVLEILRRQTEGLDHYDGCLLTHSLSGGTGSGLGSRLAEEIRTAYNKNYLLTTSILPFVSGETPLQNYNSVLSLACLQDSADGVGLVANDVVHDILARREKSAISQGVPPRISMADLNKHIGLLLAGLYMPVIEFEEKPTSTSTGKLNPFDGHDFICNVVPMPVMGGSHWINKEAMALIRTDGLLSAYLFKCLSEAFADNGGIIRLPIRKSTHASQLLVRGCQDEQFWLQARSMSKKLATRLGCPQWVPYALDLKPSDSTGYQSPELLYSMTLAHNSSDCAEAIMPLLSGAKKKFENGAFLHWYERYAGPDVHDVFQEAFETVETLLDFYGEYCHP